MWIHINCYCRICAGRNVPSSSSVSPLSVSFHHRTALDTPPSPLSPALSFTDSFYLPSPVSPVVSFADEPLSPVSPIALEPLSPFNESSTAPPSPALSIAELTPENFPSPVSPINTEYVWDLCIIPSVSAKSSIFAAQWRDETSLPFNAPATQVNDQEVSPTTLPNGKKAPPPLPPRPIPRRPKRSPLLTSKFSWGSTPTASPSLQSPLDIISAHTVKSEEAPPKFGNKPWWENIAPVSVLPSPTLSAHSFSGFSEAFVSPTTSAFDSPCSSSPTYPPFTFLGSRDVRNIYWTFATPSTAAEYFSIFGSLPSEDAYAWIRYPVPGPHGLCDYDDEEDNTDDDESAHYDWDAALHVRNPTAGDVFDPFAEVDELLAFYCDDYEDTSLISFESLSDDTSYLSFDADEYSGITADAGIADTAEMQRARYVESFLVGSVVSAVKEVCVEDVRVGSLDAILAGIF
ncbi:hypothetical protein M436DRAFT_55887 [Aureobasidium namibiae CBS 147.97]|uniref:Uncharacterized protein n=1 Tax=Aureobasidium namibiae CBS 147.97 TaxID=1043004 RepID=A0A074W8P1_9PEZI|nr:uncharacterized protein M436DRAFT_55887 [Aureobasidium namibiae CBS 147.97]KEQ69470.1 hypothetical protein M436DRAFT_55887 [Aureobasidium namibiae CBS 147.97]